MPSSPVRLAKIEKFGNSLRWQGCEKMGIQTLVTEYKFIQFDTIYQNSSMRPLMHHFHV